MLPPAPARLSITIGWPRISVSFCPAMRAMMSVGPPGANGMMTRTGLEGHACALAAPKDRNKIADKRTRVIVASLSGERQGALVVTEIDEPVGRRRLAAPLAFDLRAQREHVAESLGAEARIRRQAEPRVQQRVVSRFGDAALDLQPVHEQL